MITEILPSTLAALGADGFDDTLGLGVRMGPVRRAVVVVVDGLGADLLPRAAQHSDLLADVVHGRAGGLTGTTCTLPSTTPTSIVSLCTGQQPGAHGILGFTVRLPRSDRVLKHITWRGDPDPDRWQPVPTVFERSTTVPTTSVLPSAFRGSGLTRAAYRGSSFVATSDDALVTDLLGALERRGGLVVGYTSRVDTAAHVHGIASPQWAAACAWTGTQLERLAESLPQDAALVVTADHGGLDVPPDRRVDLDADPRLTNGVRIVAGEPRLRYLHVRPGAVDTVVSAWREILGDRADVLVRDEAVATGMFGPVAPAHLDRIGDVVVTCRGDTVVLASAHEPPEVGSLVGFHGSTTHAETAIPIITLGPWSDRLERR